MRRTFRIVTLSLGLCAGGAGQLAAMLQPAAEKVTRVDVGFDVGKAGGTVSLPIELNAPEGIRVGTTINEVTFPARWFKFVEVRRPPSADAEVKANVEVKANLKDEDKKTGNAIVQITVTAVDGKTLANGIIASVVFKIADEARKPQVLKLRNVARALNTNVPPGPIEPVTGRDGEIELLASAVVLACFFYMH